MGEFVSQAMARLPASLEMPEPLTALFGWVEQHGDVVTGADGTLYGGLSSDSSVGTWLELHGDDHADMEMLAKHWFGVPSDLIVDRLWVFARTGNDGSMAALWRDDAGEQHIVHLGSGSGSIMSGILATDPVDLLRLLAIGYEEICWGGQYAQEPASEREGWTPINQPFRDWVSSTYAVEIPRTGLELVPHAPDLATDSYPDDPFVRFIDAVQD